MQPQADTQTIYKSLLHPKSLLPDGSAAEEESDSAIYERQGREALSATQRYMQPFGRLSKACRSAECHSLSANGLVLGSFWLGAYAQLCLYLYSNDVSRQADLKNGMADVRQCCGQTAAGAPYPVVSRICFPHMAHTPLEYAQVWQYCASWCRLLLQILHLVAYGCHLCISSVQDLVQGAEPRQIRERAELGGVVKVHLFFLLKALFSFTLRPPPSVLLFEPSFHLSGQITCSHTCVRV